MDEITFLQDDGATRRFPTYSALIQREDIHGAIFIMLSKMFKDVKHLFFNYCFARGDHTVVNKMEVTKSQHDFNAKVEDAIERQGSRYVKLIVSTSLNYVTQPAMQDKMDRVL